MKRISLIISILALSLFSRMAWAQQDAMFTQYMFNGLAFNPAYAGSHEAISASFLYRNQWVNVDGAPNTTTFSLHSPLGNERIGLGVQFLSDKIGVSKQKVANISASYILPLTDESNLSFGLSAGMDMIEYDFNDLELGGTNDVYFDPSNNINDNKANVGAGIYYYSKKTFLGLSVPRILQNEYGKGPSKLIQNRHLYVYGGHVFDLHPNLKFKPNVLLKTVEKAPLEVDLNANFLFIDRIWAGVSWRSLESVDLLTRVLLTEQLSVGYSYDISTNGLKDYSKGSHEFMLNYLFSFQKKTMLSPRYF